MLSHLIKQSDILTQSYDDRSSKGNKNLWIISPFQAEGDEWTSLMFCHNMSRLVQAFGEKALSEITPQDIERFKAKLVQEVSVATTNRHLQLLNAVFNKSINWGKTKSNPAKLVKKFKENNERVRYLTEDEQDRLRAVFPEEHWPLVEVALHTGMRRGEQLNLKWQDVNFLARTITIPRSKSGKTRHVKMNDRVVEILRELPSRLKSEWVFPSEAGESPIKTYFCLQAYHGRSGSQDGSRAHGA
jgi:integrase